jgi:broad specificity phosphatase PhoE
MPDRTAQQMTDRLNSLIEEIQTFQKDNTHGEKFCDVVLVAHGHLLQAM